MAKPTREQLVDFAVDNSSNGEYLGMCRACGAEKDGCEPDARNYKCDECGKREVFGADELLIMYAG